MEISERLKIALEEKEMKPADLSEVTGISKSSISEWLKGKYRPKQDNIFMMAEALNVSPAWLMGKEVPKEWDTNPYDLIQSYIRELISKGQITDSGSIPTPILTPP